MNNNKLITIIMTICGILLINVAVSGVAQSAGDFSSFFQEFQNAVKAGDKDKVADMTDFTAFTWESSERYRKVKSRELFLKNYDDMFTPMININIAISKPIKIDKNSYFIDWHTKDLEYSIHFYRQSDGNFKFEGLAVGPD